MELSTFPSPDVCAGIAGNSDLYGLGIRVGIYLQWVSSLLTNVFLPHRASDSLDANSIFLFAIFIAIVRSTATSGGLNAVEAFIMLQLCFGYLLSVLSVSGLRLTLLNDASAERFLSKIRLDSNWMTRIPSGIQPLFGLSAYRDRQASTNEIKEQLIAARFLKPSFWRCPPEVPVSAMQFYFLKILELVAIYSTISELASNSSAGYPLTALEPIFWFFDLLVFLGLNRSSEQDASDDPAMAFRRERLVAYKESRGLATRSLRPEVFSLGLSSSWKNDRTSWFGIAWRACIVTGIGVYNVWFWFAGVDQLKESSCPSYVFLFCKANILGGARTFFKTMSIVYAVYVGALISSSLYLILAFLKTTLRSLLINFIIIPCAKIILLLGSISSQHARRWLRNLDTTYDKLLEHLGIPNMRQLLSGLAYLSSNAKDDILDNMEQDDPDLNRSVWIKYVKNIFISATILIVALTIITVELTLVFNSVSDVYSIELTSQLIPLIIGIVSVGNSLNLMVIKAIKKIYPDWSNIVISVNAENTIVIRDGYDPDIGEPRPEQFSGVDLPLQDKTVEKGDKKSVSNL